ncbi:hypothetical protein [Terracidiphilus sp.]|jgi:hypothetical protein|uniref:hypothetical protein n=1 Tax=Terracidiphilus sp. TaxID=1964191 RepID=UPI003C1C3502
MNRAGISLSLRICSPYLIAVLFTLLGVVSSAQTERKYPGRGAVSAQDLSRLASPAGAGTTAADQVCARYAVVVTATSGSGSSQIQSSFNVPITIQ